MQVFSRLLEGQSQVFGVKFHPGGFRPFFDSPVAATFISRATSFISNCLTSSGVSIGWFAKIHSIIASSRLWARARRTATAASHAEGWIVVVTLALQSASSGKSLAEASMLMRLS